MICKFCHHFDFEGTSSRAGSAHYPNWEALCASAQAGCAICALVQSRCRSERLGLNPCSEPERSREVNEPVDRDRHDWKILQQNQIRCRLYSEGTMVWKLDWFIVAHTPMFTYCK
jgi:hypothetical protein